MPDVNNLKLVLMYNILNKQFVPNLSNSFIRIRDCNKRYHLKKFETDLALPKPRSNSLKRSFKYNGAMLWNNLPEETKGAKSLPEFKKSVCSICS